jgi:hypothetical protein
VISKIIDATPYWAAHALVALGIALVLWWPLGLAAGLASGVAFYAGREFTQWESGLPFDWKGMLAPLIVNSVILAAYLAR